MKPTLLVLAAGMGSRYGGLKQMDGLGPSGETIIDYSIFDAVQAGFGKVVYIVREYFREQMEQTVRQKYSSVKCLDGSPLAFQFVTQELDKIPEGFTLNPERQKPWGTAHAVLMAAQAIHEPFVVINGDDFYGKESFRIAGDWCRAHENSKGVYAIVGFEVDHTLSETGGVSRGICAYDAQNHLTDVVEHHNVMFDADGVLRGDNSITGERHELQPKDLCSMNMWCFTPDYFKASAEIFVSFLQANINELKKEYYIPYAVDTMIKAGTAACDVLGTPSHWFGVTFKEDRPSVVAKFAELAATGVYPTPLYEER
ncbi:MAG: sugar phosphate nucleotidyltransferase [Candidatus Cryptobacteroides sp.]